MKRGKQRIKISLAKPLQNLLQQLADQEGGLERRLLALETRLKRPLETTASMQESSSPTPMTLQP